MSLIEPTEIPPYRGETPVAVDLFSGIGGLSLGLKMAGFDVRAAVEIDEFAAAGYARNHPEAWVWNEKIENVRTADVAARLEIGSGELDLLAGCPPCEGFSRIRTKNGRHHVVDTRNDLIFEFLRFVLELKPRIVMLENVPGLGADDRFDTFEARLKVEGYAVGAGVLDAADYGVPQRRKRLILIGSREGPIGFPAARARRVTVREAIASLPPAGASGDPAHDRAMRHTPRIRKLIEQIPSDGGSRLDLPPGTELECHKHFDGFKDVYGRMAWDDVAPTITAGCASPSKGRFLHPELDRVISLREAAVLQSFPRDYFIPMRRGRYAAAELIGNALPPVMIARLATPAFERIGARAAPEMMHSRLGKNHGD